MDKLEFINTVKPYAEKAGNQLGVNPDFIVAHWAHETGYGNNTGFKNNNLAGYMAYPNSKYGINGKSFSSLDEFVDTYVDMLSNKRYSQIYKADSSTGFAKALKAGGYATDPNYSNAKTWTESIELLGKNPILTSVNESTKNEVVEEQTPNFITQPVEFIIWIGDKMKYYSAMILLVILLLFFGYLVFVKESSVGDLVSEVIKKGGK